MRDVGSTVGGGLERLDWASERWRRDNAQRLKWIGGPRGTLRGYFTRHGCSVEQRRHTEHITGAANRGSERGWDIVDL